MGNELLHGALEALILRTLSHTTDHGYGIVRRIEESTDGAIHVEDGSLYPALYRLETNGLLKFEWGESDNRRRAKFYSLTPRGRKHLHAEEEQWDRLCLGIAAVMAATPEEV